MKSLANTEKFPAGRGVSVNREMTVWCHMGMFEKRYVTAWSGYGFVFSKIDEKGNQETVEYPNACEVETDENSFVRDDTTRQMTAKEIYELAHQGAAFGYYDDVGGLCIATKEDVLLEKKENFVYCTFDGMITENMSEWLWRKLEKVG